MRLRDMDPSYNCHSYTFYSTSSSNNLWLDDSQVQIYITDGSYNIVTPALVGDKAWYGEHHSAIVKRVLTNGTVIVRSKWGFGGLYEHELNNCPYETETLEGPKFYRINPLYD